MACLVGLAVCPPAHATTYYLNNASTLFNSYTTANGNDANDGLTPATPKLTVTNLFATYTLGPGDVVYIDSGTYTNYTVPVIHSGSPTNPLVFIGSTNLTGGGTVFNRGTSAADGWTLVGVSNIHLSHLIIQGARDGMVISGSPGVRLENMTIRNNSRFGLYALSSSHNTRILNSLFAFNGDFAVQFQASTNCVVASSVLWGDRGLLHRTTAALAYVSNSVIRASGTGNFIFRRESPIESDHNVFFIENDAAMASTSSSALNAIPRLSDWQQSFGVDLRSTVLDPLFVNPASFDFHPRSAFGRFVLGSFTNDAVTSPLVDFGARSAPFVNETVNNGGRMNAGRYGNTTEASRSSTNRTLLALTYNDGGIAAGTTARVAWVAGQAQPADTVKLEASLDGGGTWSIIATNVPATNELHTWNTTLLGSSGAAKWRISYEAFPAIASTNVGLFSIRNAPLAFYINDTTVTGDVFTAAIGAPGNIATMASPKDSLQHVLAAHTLSPGDTVYIDTGYYLLTNSITLGYRERGVVGNKLTFAGSTNAASGGTVFDRQNTTVDIITLNNAPCFEFRNLELRNGRTAFNVLASADGVFARVTLRDNATSGIDVQNTSPNTVIENSLFVSNAIRVATIAATNVTFARNTVYGPRGLFTQNGSSLFFENNVVNLNNPVGAVFENLLGTFLGSPDYNLYWVESGSVIAKAGATTYANLSEYQKTFNRDWNSTVRDPRFANTGTYDFHLKSAGGRWTPAGFTNDAVTSPAIDLGDPLAPFANEPSPNGARLNSGSFGNTERAAKSPTNAWLLALTYADGGVLNAPGDVVYWNAGGFPTGATVRIELSTDNGTSWSTVETNLAVTAGAYTWANTNFLSSRFSLWRVVYEANTNVVSGVSSNFIFRNGPFVYYVNDNSTAGDVYTVATGNDANLGTSPGAPKASLKSVVDTHPVQPGDIIYIDTGSYTYSINQELTSLDSGDTNDFIYIRGSTNEAAGGTVFRRGNTSTVAYGLHLNSARYIFVSDMIFRDSGVGVRLDNAEGARLERVRATANGVSGFNIRSSTGVVMRSVAAWQNSQRGVHVETGSRVTLDHAVLWRNSFDGLRVDSGFASLSNSIVVAAGLNAQAYYLLATNSIAADYNNLLLESNAVAAVLANGAVLHDSAGSWSADSGHDLRSKAVDPRFADPLNGDFHLRTEAPEGRFVPGVGFVVDSTTSLLIDGGNPAFAFATEPLPNGGRVNIGYYGDTVEASKSITNQALHAASLRQGGLVRGTATLHWVAYNLPTSHLVTVSVSADAGENWTAVATGVSAQAEQVLWNTTAFSNSPAGLWRVVSDVDPNLRDESPLLFSIRNAPLEIFVNDASTFGDVYTSGPGSSTNLVATRIRPINSLATVLAQFNLEPGDTVYLDSGNYTATSTLWTRRHGGSATQHVSLVGSTNPLTAGSALQGTSLNPVSRALELANVRGVSVSNVTFAFANSGLRIDTASDIRIDLTTHHSSSNGVLMRLVTNGVISRAVLRNNKGAGLLHVAENASSNQVVHAVIVSNETAGIQQTGGRLSLYHSHVESAGVNASGYLVQSNGLVIANYNNHRVAEGASVARFGFSVSKALSRWQEATTNDLNSLSHDPLFAGGGDYHPQSPGGRFVAASNAFVTTDTAVSPLIDTGDPLAGFSLETAPNGGRINIGRYGNTAEASRSATNARLLTLTLNDGGTIRGTNALSWIALGSATGMLVSIDYSFDGGTTWSNVATNVSAAAGSTLWDTTAFVSSPQGRWRITSQSDPSVNATNELIFSVNNNPLAFYVNDAATDGDVYTVAPGDPNNDGLTESTPVDSPALILERYELQPGDRILVDTGYYAMTNAIAVDISRFIGSSTNPLLIVGSTNLAAGGTVIDRQGGRTVFDLNAVNGVEINHFILSNTVIGVRALSSTNLAVNWVEVRGARGNAFELIGNQNATFRHCVAMQAVTNGLAVLRSTNVLWESGVFWSNTVAVRLGTPIGVNLGPSPPGNTLTMSNSVAVAFGTNAQIYRVDSGALRADYNNLYTTNGARVGQTAGPFYTFVYDSVTRWSKGTTQDVHSLSSDPRFHFPAEGDFRPLSTAGRYDPVLDAFINDLVDSPLIDAGNPAAPFTNETGAAGSRINIGRYGNTAQASRSTTNASLTVITFNDGGAAAGTETLRWVARGGATGHVMRIDVSSDGGATYTLLTSNQAASAGSYTWDSTVVSNSPRAVVRFINVTLNQIMDFSDRLFAVRNGPIAYYVNDGSLSNDVYTTATGISTNLGLSPSSPKRNLSEIIDTWSLGAGDIVYVDTGDYSITAPVTLTQLDSAPLTGTGMVTIAGSTNLTGGTRITGPGGLLPTVYLSDASGIILRDLRLQGGNLGLRAWRSNRVLIERVRTKGGAVGMELDGTENVEIRNAEVLNAASYGVSLYGASNTLVQSSVLWSNANAVATFSSTNFFLVPPLRTLASVSNTAIGVFGASARAYNLATLNGQVYADYNAYLLTNGALMAAQFQTNPVPNTRLLSGVPAWTTATSNDIHSFNHDPGFVAPGQDNFRLRSAAGRYDPELELFVNDPDTSPLVDGGGLNMPFAEESMPNGSRLNIGAFGNTLQASRTPTNSALTMISFNQGGIAVGSSVPLAWNARGGATNHSVTLEISTDGGFNWTTVASNLPAIAVSYLWDSTAYASTPIAAFRVVSEQEPGVSSATEQLFAIRNSPIKYYVNDASLTGDLYTTGPGQPTNFGVSVAAPLNSLQAVLERWDLEPGDAVYVDTGYYSNQTEVLFTQLDAAGISNLNRVVVYGSTNDTAGGTLLDRGGAGNAIRISGVGGVELRNLRVTGAGIGVLVESSEGVVLNGIEAFDNNVGIQANLSENLAIHRPVIRNQANQGILLNGSTRIDIDAGVIWSNPVGIYLIGSGPYAFSNTIFGVFGTNRYAFQSLTADLEINSDYNNFWMTGGGQMLLSSVQALEDQPELSRWVRWSGWDANSFSEDPLFVDAAGGNFRLQSAAGRYDPATQTFVNDPATSPLIDAAQPQANVAAESSPNGGRRNIGPYGGTGQASRSATNAALHVLSLNDGGRVEGIKVLTWVAAGAATGHTVRIDYSSDNGALWEPVATNLAANSERYVWDTRSFASSILGRWRIVSENDPAVEDSTDTFFALRNEALKYYVNDPFTDGDIYTTAPGSSTNLGIFAAAPQSSIQAVFDLWNVDPGDVIYVDTGNYLLTTAITIGRYDAWSENNLDGLAFGLATNRVTIQGSTNAAFGGTTFNRFGNGDLFTASSAPGLAFRHLNLLGGTVGLNLLNSPFSLVEWCVRQGGNQGYVVNVSHGTELRHNVVRSTLVDGLNVFRSTNTVWAHGVSWSNRVAFSHSGGPTEEGTLEVVNSIVGAFGSNAVVHFNASGVIESDYNNFYLVNGAFAGAFLPKFNSVLTTRYESVNFLNKGTGLDAHTLTVNPEFANLDAGDYHLKTTRSGGRFDAINGVWTNDTTFSRLIDAGRPSDSPSAEPGPNGNRVNIGLYGGTGQASRTPTNDWLTTITLNDNGSVQGPVDLNWHAGGSATGHLVYIDFSPVGGLIWTNIATNVAASAGTIVWDTSLFGRSGAGKWRVVSQVDGTVFYVSDGFIVMRDNTGVIPYFVNDLSVAGDVYSTAPGSPLNNGLLPSSPMNSVQLVLDTYKLEPIDIVYIDTGEYLLTQAITVGDLDSGSGTNRITFQGSTNRAAGGSVMNRQIPEGDTSALRLDNASGLNFRDLVFKNATFGINLLSSEDILFERVDVRDNALYGAKLDFASGIEFRNFLAWRNGITNGAGLQMSSSAATIRNSVLSDNLYAVRLSDSSPLDIRNSVLTSVSDGGRIYFFESQSSPSAVVGDYNNLFAQSGAIIAEKQNQSGGNDYYPFLIDWTRSTGQDIHSFSHGPRFADSTNGVFTLRSAGGRFEFDYSLTNDVDTSPMVDTGDPALSFANEPLPNGSRVNIGQFGHTDRASLSVTNPWLWVISLNDGGTIAGPNTLYWTSGNFSNNARVRLEFSRNGGAEWFLIASNIQHNAGSYPWDVTTEQVTSLAKWRVLSESDTNVVDETDNVFAIKNDTLTIFVNDASTNLDVFCTAEGLDTNSGLSNNVPLRSVREAFTRYPLGPGDVIYIDTGSYAVSNIIQVNEFNVGAAGNPIRVYGGTNPVAPPEITFNNLANGLRIVNTRHWEFSDLRLSQASNLVFIANSQNISFNRVQVRNTTGNGFLVSQAQNISATQCVVAASSQWAVDAAASTIRWDGGVTFTNRLGGFNLSSSTLELRNSIVHAFHPSSYVYQVNQASIGDSDYNHFWISTNARVARDERLKFDYANLSEWQKDTGADIHSVIGNPLMNAPAAGDFSLRSQAGRFTDSTTVVFDASTSWAIDAGDPAASFGLEPGPNGGRINQGHQGNSALASLSLTNPAQRELFAVSYNDGGQASGIVELYWLARSFSPTSTVRIEYTLNNGLFWELAGSNVLVDAGSFLWDSTILLSTPLARWRIISEENTNIVDTLDRTFILRNGPIIFYVNDTNTVGDLYTTAPGAPTNDGLDPGRPNTSVDFIFSSYDLEAGDLVYVDTGIYEIPKPIFIGKLDSGSTNGFVHVFGSTNAAGGGSVFIPDLTITNDTGIDMVGVSYVNIANLTLDGFNLGMEFDQFSQGNVVSNLLIRNGIGSGMRFNLSGQNTIDRSVITRNGGFGVIYQGSAQNNIRNSVIWSNHASAVLLSSANANISNSVLHAYSTNFIYLFETNAVVFGDYNNLWIERPAGYALFNQVSYEGLPQWTRESFQELYSISADPLFHDPVSDDYHPKSFMGRFDPSFNAFVTTDTNLSIMIDTGVLGEDFSQEPDPNGARKNIGLFANSAEASKSRTNAWIKTITGMNGGRLEGTLILTWAYNNIDELEPVVLDYSFDNGITWTNIGTSIVSSLNFLWQSDQKYPGNVERWPSSPIGRWRIQLATDTNVQDVTENYFALRNKKFVFYVNDTNTAGDVYTLGPGDDANLGIFIDEPKLTLQSLFDILDLEGEDLVLVDVGEYTFDTNVVWSLDTSDQGRPGLPVIIRGSTNANRTVFNRPIKGPLNELLQINGQHVQIEHIDFDGGGLLAGGNVFLNTLAFTNGGNVVVDGLFATLSNLQVRGGNVDVKSVDATLVDLKVQNGGVSLSGTNLLLTQSLIFGTNTTAGVNANGVEVRIINNTVYTRGSAVVQDGVGGSIVRNNILVADGANRFCIDIINGTLESDYNTLWARNGAWLGGYRNGNWEHLLYWQREALQDLHSIAADPRFADAANGDFRLQSVEGRWNGSTFVVDPVHSPSIDGGDPTAGYENEPLPNGFLLNQGFDGNTPLASKGLTNAWLYVLTMNDGGVFKGTNTLSWRYGNIGTAETVRLEYSADAGTNWATIVSGLPVDTGSYLWNSTGFTSSLAALWRVVLISDTSVVDAADNPFALRNAALGFYVNDASTAQDVYTTAAGNDANDGLDPATPKLTLQALLAQYDLEGGDTVYIDTGVYPVNNALRVIWSRGGDALYGHMTLQGSTNLAAGGSIFQRNNRLLNSHVLEIPASFVRVRDVTLINGYSGLYATSNTATIAEGIFTHTNEFGVLLNTTRGADLRNLRVWNNQQGGVLAINTRTTLVENATFVANSNFSYRLENTVADTIQNNIFYQSFTNAPALSGTTNSIDSAFVDYNVYYFEEPTVIYAGFKDLRSWQLAQFKDYRSAITNPLLADAASGNFHLLSANGRVDGTSIVFDAQTSWAIDRGNPFQAFDREPVENGARRNIGAFGNTPWASRGTTNVFIDLRTLNGVATIGDTNAINPLIWGVLNVPTSLIVDVQFSGDGGITWTNIATDVDAYQEFVVWQANPNFNTFKGRWRVLGEEGAVVYADTNDAPFTIFFGEFRIFNQFKAGKSLNNIQWRGAWDEQYQVQYSDNGFAWTNAVSGAGTNQSAQFLSIRGGDFTYEDVTSSNIIDRLYRVIWEQF